LRWLAISGIRKLMAIDDARKAKRGRPAVNSTPISVRLPPDQLAALDDWIAAQSSEVSRPEAIRRLLSAALG
jgi:hypothetical protein